MSLKTKSEVELALCLQQTVSNVGNWSQSVSGCCHRPGAGLPCEITRGTQLEKGS